MPHTVVPLRETTDEVSERLRDAWQKCCVCLTNQSLTKTAVRVTGKPKLWLKNIFSETCRSLSTISVSVVVSGSAFSCNGYMECLKHHHGNILLPSEAIKIIQVIC